MAHKYKSANAIGTKLVWAALCSFLLLVLVRPCFSEELTKETVQAWDRYLQWAQERVTREISNPNVFLIQNTLSPGDKASLLQVLHRGESIARRMPSAVPSGAQFKVPSGEIHHYWGTILLRNVTLGRLMQFLQDYEHHAGRFSDVEKSRLISKDGNRYKFYFRLRRSKAIVTAYYNTDQECVYTIHGPTRISSQSEATRIAEIEDAGKSTERENPPGNDRGFLWRLVSWWRFEQKGPDVLLELESASLSRDIPAFIRFIPGVSAYIRSTPKESVESVLTSIRNAMK